MSARPGAGFRERVRRELDRLVAPDGGGRPLVVAFSGGLDSCALLHALRFGEDAAPALVAAHFDHAMRAGSSADARWAAGVCRAWGVPLHVERASGPLSSEAEARAARYDFLFRVRASSDAGAVLTAHHADDQAETVLFRILRGTGTAGLRGIPAARAPGVVRPLLDVWREELEAYADEVGLRWRDDPTNDHLGYARNVLRHEVLPALEDRVAPGARRALVRLGGLARVDEEAWSEAIDIVLEELAYDGRTIDASAAARLGAPLRARVLRTLADRVGAVPDEVATRRAVRFVEEGRSGSAIELGGGVELRRELDRLWVRRVEAAAHPDDDRELLVDDVGPGRAELTLGGRTRTVRWWPGPPSPAPSGSPEAASGSGAARAHFSADGLRFPLHVRARRPGDRIGLSGGTRPVKKLLTESRVPSLERGTVPIVADADGRLLWVVGIARDAEASNDRPDGNTMTLEIEG